MTSGSGRPARAATDGGVERLAQDRGDLEQPALGLAEPIQAGGDERVQRLGHVEVLHLAADHVALAVLHQQAAVQQHPHDLHRVERHALGAVADPGHQLLREPRSEALEHRLDGLGRQGPERQSLAVGRLERPARPLDGHLGTPQREHEDREVRRPLQEVVDEVQQARVGPLDVLEDQQHGIAVRHALEEQAPAREEVGAVGVGALLEAQQMRQARLHQPALALVGHESLDRRPQLLPRGAGELLLDDARARADHLRQRPVAHALAVGQAAALVPERPPR